ncbi:MAG: glycosyltransferase family 9 protein [Planctomycetota bacterium]|mgnify:CR=1 FL=1
MKFDKILIVRLSAIGDIINTLPALTVLRTNFPKSFIAWVVEDKAKDILLNHPALDKVIVFERKKWRPDIRSFRSWLHSARTFKEARNFIRLLKQEHFDIALDFQGNFKSGLLAYLSGAKIRVGFDKKISKEGNHLFINHKIKLASSPLNRVAKNLYLLESLGLNTKNHSPVVAIPPADHNYINNFLKSRNLLDKKLIILHPGTSPFGVYKRWPLKYYTELANKLTGFNENYGVVVTWGPGERGLAEKIIAETTPGQAELSCPMNLTQLGALLKKATLFVGSDSAPLHLASALKIPLVGLYGPKDPLIYGPYEHPHSIVITKNLPCQPCRKRTCQQPDCMNLITPEEVLRSVKKLLLNTD